MARSGTATTSKATPKTERKSPETAGSKADSAGCRPLRADAARNRQKLVDVATKAFTEDIDIALDEIAKRAGVGIGTLYRHFPTRCDLVLAVYGEQVAGIEQRSYDLPKELDPGDALHEWMRGFVEYYAVKMGLINLLRSMTQGNPETFESARRVLRESAARVLQPAIEAGVIRSDASAEELTRALGGVCLASSTPEGQKTSLAVVDLIYDGLRFGAPGKPTTD